MKMIKIFFLFLGCSVCALGNATINFEIPQAFKFSFEQKIKSKIFKTEKTSYGSIEYSAPSNLRFIIKKPNPVTYISNDTKAWQFHPPFEGRKTGQVTLVDPKKNPLSQIFNWLSDYKANKKSPFSLKAINSSQLKVIFPKKNDYGLVDVNLLFKGESKTFDFKNLKEIDLNYLKKDPTKLIVTENVELIKKTKTPFTFDIPSGWTIIDMTK